MLAHVKGWIDPVANANKIELEGFQQLWLLFN